MRFSVCLSAALSALLSLWLAGAPAKANCHLEKIAELPVTMSGMSPRVPAKINGADVIFIADSGAFYSMITQPKAAELKLERSPLRGMTITGVGGEAQASATTVRVFTLAGVPLKDMEFVVAGGGMDDTAGLLGQNVLGYWDVEYDLANGSLKLMRPKGCDQAALAYWSQDQYSVLDIEHDENFGHHTIGAVFVNGVKIKAIFDTGAGYSMMTLKAAKRIGVTPTSPGVVFAGAAQGIGRRMINTWIAPITSLEVGQEQIKNARIRVGDMDLEDADMLIGADFFLSHRVYVANSQHKLYFSYNGGPVFNLTGEGKTLVVDDPAAKDAPGADTGPEPTDAAGYSRRGAAFAARHDLDRALADLDRACQMAPTEAKYFQQRALVRLENHQPLLAMTDLDQTLKLNPGDVDALVLRARLKLSEADKAGALIDIDAADHASAAQADVRLQLAGLYEAAGRLDRSVAQYGLWIDSHGDDPQMATALNGRCWVRTLSGVDLGLALKDCDHALRINPKGPNLLDSRGLTHLRLGQYPQAIADYNAALALAPKLAWSLYGRGLAELNLGQTAAGQADIAAATALRPKLAAEAKGYGIVAPGGK